MQTIILHERMKGKSIGFVPTMGYLHDGHLRLLEKARIDNDIVVLSIFVNPIQFGPNEDFNTYPRDFENDKALANNEKVDYIFFPSVEEMFPTKSSLSIHVEMRTNVLCGKSRPGHFDGVATVLTKLFHIVLPDKAYFGKKDAQQLAIVEALVIDHNFPIEIIGVDIVREADGLAKSSRNVRLLQKERDEAPELYQSLLQAKTNIDHGERDKKKIIANIKEMISHKTDGIIDYVEVLSYPHLQEVEVLSGEMIIALAVQFSKARLIDNIIFNINGN